MGRNARASAPLPYLETTFLHSNDITVFEQTTCHDLVLLDGTPVTASSETSESTDLKDSSVSLEGVHDCSALGNETSHGLFAEDIFACFGGGYRYARVPMRRSGDGYDIQIVPFQQTAKVLVCFGLPLVPIGEILGSTNVYVAGSY